jgi:hypothetical protein
MAKAIVDAALGLVTAQTVSDGDYQRVRHWSFL